MQPTFQMEDKINGCETPVGASILLFLDECRNTGGSSAPQRRTGVHYFYDYLFYADDVLLFVLPGPFPDLSVKDAGPTQTDVPNPAKAKSGFVENLFAALQQFLLITANRSSGSSGEPFYHLSPSNNLTLIRNFRGTERPPPGSASHQDGAKTQREKKTNSA